MRRLIAIALRFHDRPSSVVSSALVLPAARAQKGNGDPEANEDGIAGEGDGYEDVRSHLVRSPCLGDCREFESSAIGPSLHFRPSDQPLGTGAEMSLESASHPMAAGSRDRDIEANS
jgi:hypothetical protein